MKSGLLFNQKYSIILLKLSISLLLFIFFYLFFFTKSSIFFPFSEPSSNLHKPHHSSSGDEKCDIFTGKWIADPSGPAYSHVSCPFIEPPQNCIKNGRPDTAFLYWRWKPDGCHISSLDPLRFLKAMRNKSWAFIGDSILRNQVRSLICLLHKEDEPIEVYHDEQYKSMKWLFANYNFTLSLIWSPLLMKAEIFEDDDGVSKSDMQLHLDTIDTQWSNKYNNFDYILISGGQWFLKTAIYWEKNNIIGCHYCPEKNLTELPLNYSYQKVLSLIFNFVLSSNHKPIVIYRTWAPSHFEYREWSNGGICNRTEPFNGGLIHEEDVDLLMRSIEIEEFLRAMMKNTNNLKLLDTYNLSARRPDGHPGPYRKFHSFGTMVQNDCLHWCLPGPIDSWNFLLMDMILRN
ncbi:protein trichome birefringence-like 25 [Phalaenopsis equestris]|uniref:protein trichome birefringence-like 25 n=1 Tax=Phalaenopsis equestris TaxID=78828 RepID=UPI0009E1BF1E|nr:protein trichome birefringence-like 25 [Phalaenopsis equestris]